MITLGENAKASWLLFTNFSMPHTIQIPPDFTTEEDAPEWMHGYYEMEYVKENGAWKSSLLKWRGRLRSPRK